MAVLDAVSVSYVVPVLNEERYVGATLASILSQEGFPDAPVLVVRGRSTDGTDAILEELAARHSRIVLVDNPDNAISIAMNKGFAEADTDVVIRVDAHAVLPTGYAAAMVRALQETGAVNAGGRMRAQGDAPFQRAVAWAYNSGAGLGSGVYHVGGEPGPADSAYLGVFRREAVLAAGGYDERLSRGEDWELNFRLRERGGLVWFVPDMEVAYRPRSTAGALARQFFASGRWRGELIRRLGSGNGLKFFVPPALVAALGAGSMLLVSGAASALVGAGGVGVAIAVAGALPFVAYAAWVAVAVARAADTDRAARVRLAAVLPTMHLSWGAGCLLGLVRPASGLNAYSGR